MLNITIIGAGPVGSYAGYLLAKAGHNVNIFENHASIGDPIQCTGILTTAFDRFNLDLKQFLVNTINSVEVITPHQKIKISDKNYIICRRRFDNYIADLAKSAGAHIHLNHSFVGKEGKSIIIKHKSKDLLLTPDLVIAADGPLSPTAKSYGFYHPERENYYGLQAVVEGIFDAETIGTLFGEKVCPGLFAWVVPESKNAARVGLATLKDAKKYFDRFIEDHHFKIKVMQAGLIPVYHPKQLLSKENCFLLGDAAGFVKATTLGGIIPGMEQAEILAKWIIQEGDTVLGKSDSVYQKALLPLRRKMWLHLQIHKIFAKFTDHDWDTLLAYLEKSGAAKVLEEHNRDNPWPILFKSIFKEPRLLYFMKYLV
ncbi:NAD(P)/FAD-dependent oxidoreductase [Candidatus Woesearchaeota archaeon]|nr:NAD(P)/FAD-dependent oxidoreductase [Candidatus Woesearchaeota archaeon]